MCEDPVGVLLDWLKAFRSMSGAGVTPELSALLARLVLVP